VTGDGLGSRGEIGRLADLTRDYPGFGMKLEFLASGSRHTPLICLYGVEIEPLRELSRQIERMSLRTLEGVEVHNIPGVAAISDCRLRLEAVSNRPRSLVARNADGTLDFQAFATCEDWLAVHDLLEPLLAPNYNGGFQWLLGGDARGLLGASAIAFLVSTDPDGSW
jgi:hypothetical protein